MSAAAINRLLRRYRRRLVVVALVLSIGGAVAVHHGGIDELHMGEAMVVCLAVLPVLAAGAAVGRMTLGRRHTLDPFRLPPLVAVLPPVPRARASPVVLVVLRR
jgi:hypothetical protein